MCLLDRFFSPLMGLIALIFSTLASTYSFAVSDSAEPKLPQLDVETYISQIFWLIVSFVILYILVSKIAIPRIAEVLEERQDRIEDDLDKAESLNKEAQLVRVEFGKDLLAAREKASIAIREAQDEITRKSTEVEAAANQKVTAMVQEAEARIRVAREKAVNAGPTDSDSLEHSVARDVVAEAVNKLIGVQVRAKEVEGAVEATIKGFSR